ncbi:MAG TPA: tripartite tricarboxylate transporter substrate binding protein [Ramlibacter sp.]|nr:tripartite tricarboxylate transporter substrate binding protein [Ramlibacter sp.]
MRLLRYLTLGLALVVGAAGAQSYPDKSKPLKIILPQAPGSASDVLARALAKAITDTSGWTTIVDYKPGAETVIGVQSLLNSPADGYSVLLVSSSTPVLNPVMIPNLQYDPFRDFIPLVGISKAALAMNLGPSTNFKTAREFIAAAKANPGKYTFASSTATTRLAGELLQSVAGIKLLNVPYKATAAGATALAAGEVDLMMVDPSSINMHWQSGRVRPVAVSGSTRLKAFPNIPTLKEEGQPDYEVTAWFATYFARGTPPEVSQAMREVLRKATQHSSMVETLGKVGMEPLELAGDDITALARKEVEMWTKVVKAANLKPQ